MKLDRNINENGRGKYALIKLRSPDTDHINPQHLEGAFVVPVEAVDFGSTADTEFFVIRLKDKYATPALIAYAEAALADDPEYAQEIGHLATLSAFHLNKQRPT